MGEVFAGHYELIDLVGLGSMGAVWRAWDRRQQTYVAAKLLRQTDAPALLKFVREESAALDHRHLLVPRAWAGSDEQVLISTDLVRGGPVATLLVEHGPLPYLWVAALLDQLLDALSAMHRSGLVHRDVRSAKLLLEPTGQDRPYAWLTGFTKVTRGDARDDLYAAGLLAAELLTGLRPDRAAGVGPAPLDVPDALWAWVRRLAALEPQERPAHAAAARAELAATKALPVEGAEWPAARLGALHVPDRLGELPHSWGPEGPGVREEPPSEEAASMYDDIPALPRVLGPGAERDGGEHGDGEASRADERAPAAEPGPAADPGGAGASAPAEAHPSDEIPVLPDLSAGLQLPTGLQLPRLPPEAESTTPAEPEPAAQEPAAPESDAPEPAAEARQQPDQVEQPVADPADTAAEPVDEERVPLSQRAWQVRELGLMEPPPMARPEASEPSMSPLPPLELDEKEPGRWRRWLLVLLALAVLGGAAYGIYFFVQNR